MTTPTQADRAALARAIALAARPPAPVSPNPSVGCVIVHRERVVGEGVTEADGGRHAEVVALDAAGDRARDATAYVSLEPCAHHGRTPPCADALREAGIARVVIVHEDPNPAAAGGRERLRAAGIEVVGPLPAGSVLHGAVERQLEGFLSVVRRGRPHLTLKLAQTEDGALLPSGPGRWVTGPAARRAVHRWRASVDAVLVGSGTVLADDPRLDVRDVPAAGSPRPVVLDGRLRIPVAARLVARGALVLTRPDAPAERRKALLEAGADLVEVPAAEPAGLDLPAAMETLATHGITSVLAEPGAMLGRALLDADLVDRLVLHVALQDVGDRLKWFADPTTPRWRIERCGGAGPDLIVQSVRARDARRPLEGAA